jgi:hypothetical protein
VPSPTPVPIEAGTPTVTALAPIALTPARREARDPDVSRLVAALREFVRAGVPDGPGTARAVAALAGGDRALLERAWRSCLQAARSQRTLVIHCDLLRQALAALALDDVEVLLPA